MPHLWTYLTGRPYDRAMSYQDYYERIVGSNYSRALSHILKRDFPALYSADSALKLAGKLRYIQVSSLAGYRQSLHTIEGIPA